MDFQVFERQPFPILLLISITDVWNFPKRYVTPCLTGLDAAVRQSWKCLILLHRADFLLHFYIWQSVVSNLSSWGRKELYTSLEVLSISTLLSLINVYTRLFFLRIFLTIHAVIRDYMIIYLRTSLTPWVSLYEKMTLLYFHREFISYE